MALAPQITNTPVTITNTSDYVVTYVANVQNTTTTFTQSTQPSAQAIGDIWFDTSNGNKQYRWDGSNWVSVQDGSIYTAQTTANSALSAATAASTAASTAQSTANGKNKVTYSSGSPGSTANSAGDIWFQYTTGGVITAQYTGQGGTSWVSNTLSNIVVSSLDAGKITSGTISSIAINNGSGTFSVTSTGALTASSANISGVVNASSGSIGGWTINSGGLFGSGTYYVYYNGVANLNTVDANGTLTAHSDFYGNGTSYLSTLNVSSNLNANGNMYYGNSYTVHSSSGSGGDLPLYENASGYIYTKSSSARFKKDIQTAQISMDNLMQLRPATYVSNEDFENNNNSGDGLRKILGLIAEEVAEIDQFKDLIVGYDPKDETPFSISYDSLAVALVPAIQELNNRLTTLEGKINGTAGN